MPLFFIKNGLPLRILYKRACWRWLFDKNHGPPISLTVDDLHEQMSRTRRLQWKGLFSGFAKNRDTVPTATVTIILYADVQTACDAGARCAIACFNDSTEWNFIEVRRVRMFRIYPVLQETTRKIVCSCFLQLEAPIIQYSPLWYYGYISDGEIVSDGKNISV